jgi:hypothetical protein
MNVVRMASIVTLVLLSTTPAFSQGKPAPDDAYLYFIWPDNGTVIKGAFWCRFGLRNMGVTHAVPQDKNHLHFGAGQTEARIELPPGRHTLQLVLGDAKHFPFKPPVVSKKITVVIK